MDIDKELEQHRLEIDRIDARIIELLGERAAVAKKIGHVKRQAKLTIRNEGRESEVLKQAMQNAKDSQLDPGKVGKIFEQVVRLCRQAQKK